MTVSHLQGSLAAGRVDPQNSPEGPSVEQAARNRELARAIRAINANEVFGPGNELRFSLDPETGTALIRIVDRATNEVLNQIPPEELLHMAAVLDKLSASVHFA